jgi:hypothetical protein
MSNSSIPNEAVIGIASINSLWYINEFAKEVNSYYDYVSKRDVGKGEP